jgi:hypothetical protein
VESQSFNAGQLFKVINVGRRQNSPGFVSAEQAFPCVIDRIAERRDQSQAGHEHVIGT